MESGWRRRTLRWAFTVLLGVVMVLSLLPPEMIVPPTLWDKANHFAAFAMLAVLGCRSYPDRQARVAVGLLGYGCLIELLQGFTGYRTAEALDVVADAAGLLFGWGWVARRR